MVKLGVEIQEKHNFFDRSESTIPIKFESNGLAIENEMLTDAANAGLRIKEVEIGVEYDVACSSVLLSIL
ncbi:MAG TPA: hypothetical protein VN368_03530 [Candidatus Methylomirabilis sp.]|nr:hypothetical protein [Candidatus Methylomirabilis sp.]